MKWGGGEEEEEELEQILASESINVNTLKKKVDILKTNSEKIAIKAKKLAVQFTEAIEAFFKNLFNNKKDVPIVWPKGSDKPDMVFDKLEAEFTRIMAKIHTESDPRVVDNLMIDFREECDRYIKEAKESVNQMREAKYTGRYGQKHFGMRLLHFVPFTRVRKVNKAIDKYSMVNGKVIAVVRDYQNAVTRMAGLIKTCEIADRDTSMIEKTAEKRIKRDMRQVRRHERKAGRQENKYNRITRKIKKNDSKHNKTYDY